MLNRRSRREEPMKRKTALKWREELLFENFLDIHDEHEIWDIKCLISYFGATHLSKMSYFRHVNGYPKPQFWVPIVKWRNGCSQVEIKKSVAVHFLSKF